jgi:Transglutaminase-like superfamily
LRKTTFYILTILLLIAANGFSQSDFVKIDEYARSIDYNPNKPLAKEVTKNLTTDLEKVRAIFVWITDNIEYDFELYKNPELQAKLYTSTNDIIENTLNTKKAICGGYSYLFKSLCDDAGIECVYIDGLSRQYLESNEEKTVPDHAWNAVKIDGKWFLLDTTWASGNGFGNRFEKGFDNYWFLTNPKEFFYSHYPTEQKWTLLNEKYNREKFYDLPATISHHLFTQGISVINPESGTIKVGANNKFIFVIKVDNLETDISLLGSPWETYASLNNLPKPTNEEYLNDIDKYSLLIPSIELTNKTIDGNKITLEYTVKHRTLENISLSVNGLQTADYKVEWK